MVSGVEVSAMSVGVAPMLAVSDGAAAIEFYKSAFDAKGLWCLGDGPDLVAGLSIDGAKFFLAYEAPKYGTRGPSSVGFTTVRIELLVDDPASVQHRALLAGAIEHSDSSCNLLRLLYAPPASEGFFLS
jgi:PhnB protein